MISIFIYNAIYNSSTSFVHGHTYGGNPLSCAVALAVQEYIETHDLVTQCARMGELMLEQLMPLQGLPIVGEVRGKGLLIGIEFVACIICNFAFFLSLRRRKG